MEIEETKEERKQMVMEYLTQLYFDKGSIDKEQLLPMALYLYKNADLGPKGTKKIAKELVKLNDIVDELSVEDCKNISQMEEAKDILKKIDRYSNCRLMHQYVELKAKETLERADKVATSRTFVYDAYHDMFFGYCSQLRIDCQQKEYSMIYLRTQLLLELLNLNEKKQADIINCALDAKARLEELIRISKNSKQIIVLSEIICALDDALEEMKYRNMQEETIYANATFAQATGNTEYQKQISIQIENMNR